MASEALKTNPRAIPGRWREGYVLDIHTTSSVHIGDDDFGRPMFNTTRSAAGEMLYRLKYSKDATAIEPICDALAGFVRKWKPGADLVVPVPPSRKRAKQPVLLLANGLSERLKLPLAPQAVSTVAGLPEMKDVHGYDARMKLLKRAFKVDGVKGRRVLLLDDLYRSGATMNAIAAALYDQGEAADVVALAVTQTRSNR
jgi:competence protein ComFC